MSDPSLLRFLVDLRDADPTDKQLRDDLMTMLIAGHETTAAVLTWALYCLAQHPDELQAIRREVDAAVGDAAPGEHHSACRRCGRPALTSMSQRCHDPAKSNGLCKYAH